MIFPSNIENHIVIDHIHMAAILLLHYAQGGNKVERNQS